MEPERNKFKVSGGGRMRTRRLFLLGLGMAVAAQAQEPQWLTDARAREGKTFRPTTVAAQDRSFRARVPAKVVTKKIVKGQSSYSIAFDVGAERAMECEIAPDGYDLAGALALGAEREFKTIGDSHGRIERKQVLAIDAGALKDWPFLAIDWLFTVNDGKGARVGGMQQMAALRDGYGIYCRHDEIGYRKTFRELMTALVSSLDLAKPPDTPKYTDVSVITVRGQRLGLTATWVTTDSDGERKYRFFTSTLVVRSDGGVSAADYHLIEFVQPDGSLINSVYAASEQGELETNLNLKRDDEGKWRVGGTYKSKAIDESVKTHLDPESTIGQADTLKALFAKPSVVGTTVTSVRWVPDDDPTTFAATQTAVRKQIAVDRFEAVETDGTQEMTIIVERQTGIPISGTMQMGPVAIEYQRIYASGAY